ncbi:REP-associated tyrosine transposase [Marinicellulosiphila megalodicopiae]|uniref:REP-associated tyrosine transposase n=1 Tax=Marinicellulosiphila megalodicopiae TaxID=2724896 RepID=UPI003BAE4422
MARPLRIEFAGALYHITARGNARGDIYVDEKDRAGFLELLATACDRYHWICHGYCLMDNHYHLLIETSDANLSKGMKYINGSYTQNFNRKHKRAGHVFQGRFKSILVEQDSHLLELCRYIVLNPVRAQMVRSAKDWPWSSYRGTVDQSKKHDCLTTDWVLSNFGKMRKPAVEKYRTFIKEGKNQPSPWLQLKNQVFLGSDEFVEDMQCKISLDQSLIDVPKKQKLKPVKPLDYYQNKFKTRNEAMAKAYLSGHYTLEKVGEHFGVSYATVSRAVKQIENKY